MFDRILIPTDGSPLAAQAANAGISFARTIGAEIVAVQVVQPFSATAGFDGLAAAYASNIEEYEKTTASFAAQHLQSVIDRADTAEVKAEAHAITNISVAEGIVQAAKDHRCDLIFIGSHGRSGLSRLILGSVASKVVSLAHIGVLVYRVKD